MTDSKKFPIYVYRSPYGTMSIRPVDMDPPVWCLAYEVHTRASNGEALVETRALNEGWSTPEKVAELVLQQRSGWAFWDSLPRVCFPAALDDWQQIEPYGDAQMKN